MPVNHYPVISGSGSFIVKMSRMQGSPEVLNNFPLRTRSEEVSKCISVAQILVLVLSTGDLWM